MNKILKILSLALIGVITLSLVGCGTASKLDGEWEGTATINGLECDAYFEFDEEENKVTIEISAINHGMEKSFDYEFSGKTLLIDGAEIDHELKDNEKLTLKIADAEFELEKID